MKQFEKDEILGKYQVKIPRFNNLNDGTTPEEQYEKLEDYTKKEIVRLYNKIRKIVREDVIVTD